VALSRKGAKSRTGGRKLRSTGTKAKTRVDRMHKPPADLEQQLESCRRELTEAQKHLTEALERQTATSEARRHIEFARRACGQTRRSRHLHHLHALPAPAERRGFRAMGRVQVMQVM
jgi:chromosome segregation ATPase